jgi:hypothetical protein
VAGRSPDGLPDRAGIRALFRQARASSASEHIIVFGPFVSISVRIATVLDGRSAASKSEFAMDHLVTPLPSLIA